jgi:NAD-dependent SIR2 family protein deacetylase
MVHGDFKPGEICKASGTYQCRTCQTRSRSSRIEMKEGGTFPECASCKERGALEIDTIWKLESAREPAA